MNAQGKILPDVRGVLPLLLVLGLWQVEGAANSPLFPSPASWWSAIVMLAGTGVLLPALEATLAAILLSLAIASVAGLVLAGPLGRFLQCGDVHPGCSFDGELDRPSVEHF
jgi:ABC-type nitrate/sulfonate/bicarbonate transport system permease component